MSVQDEEIVSTTSRLPGGIYEALRRLAYERHVSMNSMLVAALAEWLERQQDGELAGAAR